MSNEEREDDPAFTLSVPLELDEAGFLRRECPYCEREFKWLHSPAVGAPSEPMPVDGYHCPYCRRQAKDDWHTKAQAEYITAYALAHSEDELLGPLRDSVDRLNEGGGWIEARLESDFPKPVKPEELNDMSRIDFQCHPREPVKVLEAWAGDVFCLICGGTAS